MTRKGKRVLGRSLLILGLLLIGIFDLSLISRAVSVQELPFSEALRFAYGKTPSFVRILTWAGPVLFLSGLVLVVVNREEPWLSRRNRKRKRALKAVANMTDPDLLRSIRKNAVLAEVRDAAAARHQALLLALLDSGDAAVIQRELNRIIPYGMDGNSQEFLAEAAKKRPSLVLEFWPQLQEWAHEDSIGHNDTPAGVHADHTQYYDYYRYRDGRTVPNRNGRKTHTDQRAAYGDCHDDSHTDAQFHTDAPHADRIQRFRPVMPEETEAGKDS